MITKIWRSVLYYISLSLGYCLRMIFPQSSVLCSCSFLNHIWRYSVGLDSDQTQGVPWIGLALLLNSGKLKEKNGREWSINAYIFNPDNVLSLWSALHPALKINIWTFPDIVSHYSMPMLQGEYRRVYSRADNLITDMLFNILTVDIQN